MDGPSFLWSLLCDHFLIDQAGKYSFIGIFDRIGAMAFPVVQRSLYVVVQVRIESDSRAGIGVLRMLVPLRMGAYHHGGRWLGKKSAGRGGDTVGSPRAGVCHIRCAPQRCDVSWHWNNP